ncbi:hypothetical protein K491DRAFT_303954 [Lophiostoma macrostomum CBS 122681]|uniref:F-box domain-containing protein n=1 Tax=Lophiostoma macrostomum CBS 122681 TaxID=1314788 RepID=A0A6A6SKR2_9PLEO|nr:hypothetical protein K491DRAFT_303954 [Lophiostoma macrostomum CBS 122681]
MSIYGGSISRFTARMASGLIGLECVNVGFYKRPAAGTSADSRHTHVEAHRTISQHLFFLPSCSPRGPMMLLLDLPSELLERILDVFIEIVPLSHAFRARSVCRFFASVINHALLAKTPSETLSHHLTHASARHRPEVLRTFLKKNLGTLILNHTRYPRGIPPNVPDFINYVVAELMEFVPTDGDTLAIHEQYQQDLIALTVSDNVKLHEDTMFDLLGIEKQPRGYLYDSSYYDMIDQRKLSPTQALCAAAAVGSLHAVEYTIQRGGQLLEASKGAYACPISAAAITNQQHVLELFIAHLEQAISEDLEQDSLKALEKILNRVIKDSIRSGKWEALSLLLGCYQRCAGCFPWDDTMNRYSAFWSWLIEASTLGCVETFTTLTTILEDIEYPPTTWT